LPPPGSTALDRRQRHTDDGHIDREHPEREDDRREDEVSGAFVGHPCRREPIRTGLAKHRSLEAR